MSTTKRLTKAFSDVLDARTNPADDWVSVGAGFLAEAIDHMDWLEKGNAEWRSVAALQSAKVARNWHPPLYWSGRHERAVLIPRGVLLEKWQVDARAWMPFTRLTLED